MIKINLTILLLFVCTLLFSQSQKMGEESIADCSGAVNIFESGKYTLQFTGEGGISKELLNYPSLSEISEQNLIWVTYIAENDGILNFNAAISEGFIQMVIFEEMANNICIELSEGIAEIKRVFQQKNQVSVGLNTKVTQGILYPLELKTGQKIKIAFSTSEKSLALVNLDFRFIAKNTDTKASNETKITDTRNDDFSPTLSILVRDAESGKPIIANLTIDGSKELAALYKGSDIFLNVNKPAKIEIKCDAEGYFFVDQQEDLFATINQEIILKMEPVAKGKSLQIEEIEFKPGSSEFMPGSEDKLRRLKDFMALNAGMKIEIQGHVFLTGDNSFNAQKMSEARARRVMLYLVENGILKERMTAVGYGNTKPIYPNAKLADEEQANRRVEILVK
jgi:outer membrane protein OmpA-like peptidoglycan-associated protein